MSYKLTYFTCRGRGEPIRMLLVDNEIAFEDKRVAGHEWPAMKSQFAFGQIPCLCDGDKQIVQSGAIMRHLGRKHNLQGDSELDHTFADMFFEGCYDLHTKYRNMIYQAYETQKDNFIAKVYPVELANLEQLLKTHNDGKAYVLGEKISYVDYMLFEELDIATILDSNALRAFPTLTNFHNRMEKRPHLQVSHIERVHCCFFFPAYLAKRREMKIPVNGNGKQ